MAGIKPLTQLREYKKTLELRKILDNNKELEGYKVSLVSTIKWQRGRAIYVNIKLRKSFSYIESDLTVSQYINLPIEDLINKLGLPLN